MKFDGYLFVLHRKCFQDCKRLHTTGQRSTDTCAEAVQYASPTLTTRFQIIKFNALFNKKYITTHQVK